MPPKTLISTYIELITRGEHISNSTLRRKNSRSPLAPTHALFEQYAKWYWDVKKYFHGLGEEAEHLFYRYELTHIPTQAEDRTFYHYTNKQLGEGFEKLRRDVNKIKKSLRESRDYVEDEVNVTDTTIRVARNSYSFRFNILTGEVVLNDLKTHMPVGQKKYIALKCIAMGPGQKGTYVELYKALGIESHTEKDRRLHDIMREVKTQLRILPKSTAENSDIFINLQNDGYALK